MTAKHPDQNPRGRKRAISIRRYRVVAVPIAIFVLSMFISILRTMFVDGAEWRRIGESQYVDAIKPLSPMRGYIYSSDGEVVAISPKFYRLYLDFRTQKLYAQRDRQGRVSLQDSLRMADSVSRELDTLAMVVSKRLSTTARPISTKEIRSRWEAARIKKSGRCEVINLNLSYIEVSELSTHPPFNLVPLRDKKTGKIKRDKGGKTIMVRRPLAYALIREELSIRLNPFGSLGQRTIGTVFSDQKNGLSVGRNGIEQYYDSLLRGENGKVLEFHDGARRIRNIIQEPIPGCDVYMTLNMRMQSIIENALRDMLITAKAESGTAVLMEVNTGQIKAITNLGSTSHNDEYKEIMNYAVSDLSPPGSTFKTVSLLVALQDGKCRITDTIDVGNGTWKVANKTMKDWTVGKMKGLGRISLADALAQSSNVAIAKMVQKAYGDSNPERFVQLIRATGLTDDFHLEIKGSTRAIVRLPNEIPESSRWKGTWAWMAHGYETQVPPIATLAFYNAIANGGTFMRPYFVTKVMRQDEVVMDIKPKVVRQQIASHPVITDLQDALRRVVVKGTAKAARSNMVHISGKTGTAVLTPKGKPREYQLTFACYFPSEAPRYSLIVVIRKPQQPGYSGAGTVCGAVAKKIAEGITSMESSLPIDSLRLNTTKPLPRLLGGERQAIEKAAKVINLPVSISDATTPFLKPVFSENGRISMMGLTPIGHGVIPDVRGLAAMDAMHVLAKSGYESILIGYGMVVGQSAIPGSRVPVGSQIRLQLNKVEGMNRQSSSTLSHQDQVFMINENDMDEALSPDQIESVETGNGILARPQEDPGGETVSPRANKRVKTSEIQSPPHPAVPKKTSVAGSKSKGGETRHNDPQKGASVVRKKVTKPRGRAN